MRRDVRFVAPFRPMPAECEHHKALPEFDWIAAIRMMRESVYRAGRATVYVLTDVDTDLPFPMLRYKTTHRRLMLWYLEVCLAYLASEDFDRDTIMLDSDQLVFGDLSRWFETNMDLGLLVRPPPPRDKGGYLILNGVQFWAVQAKDRLVDFYRQALAIAVALPEAQIAWGADTIALQQLIAPYAIGSTVPRAGVRVRMIFADSVLERCSRAQIHNIRDGQVPVVNRDVVDFRNRRKEFMADFYKATLGQVVA
jgi:hypothetical protein